MPYRTGGEEVMEKSRRNFLKVAGVSALGLSAANPVLNAFASSDQKAKEASQKTGSADQKSPYKKDPSAIEGTHWAMVIDTRKLNDKINAKIVEACHKVHNVPKMENKRHEIHWIWEESYHHAFPMKENEFMDEKTEHIQFPVLCNHCENPPCVQACPTKATFQREDGIVMMDFHRCIGCRFCMAACPFGARSFNFRDPRPFIENINNDFPTRMKGVVEKCNFCAERLAVGKLPACVEVSEGALVFGDLDDPKSEVRKLLKENYTIRRKQSLGTSPSVYYII
jgi:molybdopterin-containing oxidoreductase family iron-sulfur binding subunit